MNWQWKKTGLALGLSATTVVTLAMPADAQARDPRTSSNVDAVRIDFGTASYIDDDNATAYVGIGECRSIANNNPNFEVTFETLVPGTQDFFNGVYYYDLARDDGSTISCINSDGEFSDECAGELSSSDYSLVPVDSTVSDVDVDIEVETLTGLSTGDDCVEGELDRQYYVQLMLRRATSTGQYGDWTFGEARLVVDLVRPEAPTLTDVLTTEDSIRVEYDSSSSDDVEVHHVVYSTEPFSAGDSVEDLSSRALSAGSDGEGRVNASNEPGTTVYVGMAARDRAENFSVVSAPLETTVVETNTFWDFYSDAGGAEGSYGCQSAGQESPAAALWMVMAALLAFFVPARLRRRRRQQVGPQRS